MELWDLFDENRNALGKTHERGKPLSNGEYHIVTDIWTVRSDGKVLITKRHPNKIWGNMWECTGGSALAGETSEVSAARELEEEVGISVKPEDLRLLHTIRVKDRFVDTYGVLYDTDEAHLTLQDTEVIEARFVDYKELNQIWQDNMLVPRERFLMYRQALKDYIDEVQKK
ncbi:MAG: NUDIX domain-containing protein [Eubacteriales bacterium]|nr:NUDIX domain-containing protein [Eubacteriales bacterium]